MCSLFLCRKYSLLKKFSLSQRATSVALYSLNEAISLRATQLSMAAFATADDTSVNSRLSPAWGMIYSLPKGKGLLSVA